MPVTINGNGAISGLVIATGDIADGAVTTPKIADGAVATVDIADGAVTLPKMANVATGTVLGRSTAGVGVPEALTTLPAVSGANLTNLNATNLASGTVPDARFPATLPAASGANLTNLNASNLSTGTVGTARLGTGTANSTTFLRGDGTWAAAGGAPANLGDVGTVAIAAVNITGSWIMPGGTTAGSNVYIPTTFVAAPNGANGVVFTQGANSSARPNTQLSGYLQGASHQGYANRTDTGNVGFQIPGGLTQQSGTWRVLGVLPPRVGGYDSKSNTTESRLFMQLMQRIS